MGCGVVWGEVVCDVVWCVMGCGVVCDGVWGEVVWCDVGWCGV